MPAVGGTSVRFGVWFGFAFKDALTLVLCSEGPYIRIWGCKYSLRKEKPTRVIYSTNFIHRIHFNSFKRTAHRRETVQEIKCLHIHSFGQRQCKVMYKYTARELFFSAPKLLHFLAKSRKTVCH